MNKLITLLILTFLATAIYAQKGKVTSALSYKETGDLKKAYETITVALDSTNPKSTKSVIWPEAWEVQGEILQEIYRKDAKDIVGQPLFKAYDSYIKAIELDKKRRIAKSIAINLNFLQIDLSNCGIAAFNEKKFAIAQACFEKYMLITNNPLMNTTGKEIIDTAIIYNAGKAAYQASNWDDAIKYFGKTAAINFNGGESYCNIYKAYYEKGDTIGGFEVLKEGFNAFPDNECLTIALINYYIDSRNPDDAIKYLDLAIKNSPENVSLYTAKGSTLEKLGHEDEAIAAYQKAIEKDATQFTPYYNTGVIYYNRGINKINEANLLPPNAIKEYDAAIESGKEELKLALPYLEKAHELDANEIAIMESLKLIYYRLINENKEMSDKFDDIVKKIESYKL